MVKRHPSLSTRSVVPCSGEGFEVDLAVRSLDGSGGVDIKGAWSVPKLPISLQGLPSSSDIGRWPHLRGIEIPEIRSEEVMLLIGNNVPEAFWKLDERKGNRGEPYAVQSLLGWTVQGPVTSGECREAYVNFQQLQMDMLSEQLNIMYNQEFNDPPSNGKLMSLNDKRALKIMEDTVHMDGGHYKVALPWKHENVNLPNNKALAEARLKLLGKRLQKNPELQGKYVDQIEECKNKGYATKASELPAIPGKVWYLPHHGVTSINKPDKLRVVFDCAARYKGTSLNDNLLQGPDLVNSLVGVLIRFRQESIALVSDIQSMFHQGKVAEEDRSALRFLWWRDGDPENEVEEYCMNVHIFGATSSPSCTAFCLKQTAADNKAHYSAETIATIGNNVYVDDLLKSVPSVETGITLAYEIRKALQEGGFRLTK